MANKPNRVGKLLVVEEPYTMPKTVTGFPRACDALQTRWNISRLPRIAQPSHAALYKECGGKWKTNT